MQDHGGHHVGLGLITLGVLFLLAKIFDVSVGAILVPGILIGLGFWLLLRQRQMSPETVIRQKFIGDIKRRDTWTVGDEEIRVFIGNVDLDFTQTQIPTGETTIRVFGFINEMHIKLPGQVGVALETTSLIGDIRFLGNKQDKWFTTTCLASERYDFAKRRIRIKTTCFIHEVNVTQV